VSTKDTVFSTKNTLKFSGDQDLSPMGGEDTPSPHPSTSTPPMLKSWVHHRLEIQVFCRIFYNSDFHCIGTAQQKWQAA